MKAKALIALVALACLPIVAARVSAEVPPGESCLPDSPISPWLQGFIP